MSTKKQTISDKILDLLKPKDLHHGDDNENDETTAKFESFDENLGVNEEFSEIRKKNVKYLGDLDSKYKGKVVSRKELEADDLSDQSDELDSIGVQSENESDSEDNDQIDDSEDNEDVDDNNSENVEEDEDGEENDESEDEEDEDDDEDDDFGDDYDISQFSKPSQKQSIENPVDLDQDNTQILRDNSISDDVKKGISVQNQLKMWEKLLELRIKSQKLLISTNGLPDPGTLEQLQSQDEKFIEKMEETSDSVCNLLDKLLELQSVLVHRYPETKDLEFSRKRKKDPEEGNSSILLKNPKLSEFEDIIQENFDTYKEYQDSVIQKWYDRTKTVKGSKNALSNLNILTKIENSLLTKNEMIRKTQIYRGDYPIYGVKKPQEENLEEKIIPEIFDDSEFYHQLLRELIEFKTNTSENQTEITKKFVELQKVRSKMKKKVDTRASKGRKLRYTVHNKLVNFMAPRDISEWTEEAKTELYNSLFGKAN